MSHINIDALLPVYRDGLLDDTMPFWMNCCLDEQFGGYTTIVDRDGTVIDDDKPVWVQDGKARSTCRECNWSAGSYWKPCAAGDADSISSPR